MAAPLLAAWPWQGLGHYKYLLYLPIVLAAAATWGSTREEGESMNAYAHILAITAGRALVYQGWQSFSRFLPLAGPLLIRRGALSFAQVDREWHCDNHFLLQALLLFFIQASFGVFQNLPLWDTHSLIIIILLHIGPSECLYYWLHRMIHESHYLFQNYHRLHHASLTPEPSTVGSSTFLEQLVLAMVMGIPIIGGSLISHGLSWGSLYGYILVFEWLRAFGHSNVEVVPTSLFKFFPFLRYILYTPSYHTLHHEYQSYNFCLFMPFYDYLGDTLHSKTQDFHTSIHIEGYKNHVPDFVFLIHGVDSTSFWHLPFFFRSTASHSYRSNFFFVTLWPIAVIVGIATRIWGSAFVVWDYYIGETRWHQVWGIPRFGFMYFLPFERNNINQLIERAILKADQIGVKVMSLGALNKNESLNGGGKLFVEKYPKLQMRLCHGNTLTTAVILKSIPKDVSEVFLTGSTSKIGRAIALYLCNKGVRVLMLTKSEERFDKVKKEASFEKQKNLVHVTSYKAGRNCSTWIVGAWASYSNQMMAPIGASFHQFVVPPIQSYRNDCIYDTLAAIKLPNHVRGLVTCEYTLDRYFVHACHAGGVVHALEGRTHHEVGAIDVTRIDIVWEAALKHGFTLT